MIYLIMAVCLLICISFAIWVFLYKEYQETQARRAIIHERYWGKSMSAVIEQSCYSTNSHLGEML